jgi:uncharacterized protein YciI
MPMPNFRAFGQQIEPCMQFLILATDGTDSDAPSRRSRARDEHRALIGKLKASGNFKLGGHTLDFNERIVGSAVIVDFPSREELEAYLRIEPYVVQHVWEEIKITRINLG